jgi:hypothetical protein
MPILGPLDPAQRARSARGALVAAAQPVRPDHRTIATGSVQFYPTGMRRFYLYAAVAPSRRAARAFDERQVGRAAAFPADAFGGVFDATPSVADQDTTVFTVSGDDGADERALYVHRSGLVELLWALAVEQPEGRSGELALDASEIAAVLARVAAAVGRPRTPSCPARGAGGRGRPSPARRAVPSGARAAAVRAAWTGQSTSPPTSRRPMASAHGRPCGFPARPRRERSTSSLPPHRRGSARIGCATAAASWPRSRSRVSCSANCWPPTATTSSGPRSSQP